MYKPVKRERYDGRRARPPRLFLLWHTRPRVAPGGRWPLVTSSQLLEHAEQLSPYHVSSVLARSLHPTLLRTTSPRTAAQHAFARLPHAVPPKEPVCLRASARNA